MIARTAKKRNFLPNTSGISATYTACDGNPTQLPCTEGCYTTSAFSGHGKKSCWKTFLVNGVGHHGELAPVEEFMCYVYGILKLPTINQTRLHLFGKAKKGLEMFPPTIDALDLHTIRANYQIKIWLQTNKEQHKCSTPSCHHGLEEGCRISDSSLDKTSPT